MPSARPSLAGLTTSPRDLSRGEFLRMAALASAGLVGATAFAAPAAPPSISLKGRPFTSLPALAKQLGLTLSATAEKTRLAGPGVTLDFFKNKAPAHINGLEVWLAAPVVEQTGQLYLPSSEIGNTLLPVLLPQKFSPVPRLAHIVIDPGHGGKDPGALNTAKGLQEKALTLDIALRLRPLLQKRGIKVTLTRSTDVYLELEDRPAIANQAKADFFLSLHFNASAPAVRGQESFALSPAGDFSSGQTTGNTAALPGNRSNSWNTLAAYLIQRDLVSRLPEAEDRGVKRSRFKVLTSLNCPGTLIESGFVTHPREAALLGTPAYRQSLATSLDYGLARYASVLSNLRSGAVKR